MVELNYVTLPESFFEEETRLDYKISRQMKDVWAIELDMLALVKSICEKHDIKWWIHAGTLLGAVRDGHFIPWDDDIDVMMTRENYEKFLTAYEEEKIADPYYLKKGQILKIKRLDTAMASSANAITTDSHSGIGIDIFVLDRIPDGDEKSRKNFIAGLLALRNRLDKKEEYKAYACKYNEMETECYMDTNIIGGNVKYFNSMIYKAECFENTVTKTFEGIECPVPAGYEVFLTDKYGESWATPQNLPANHITRVADPYNSYKVYAGINDPKKINIDVEILKQIREVNSLVYTGKSFVEAEEGQTLVSTVTTYDDVCAWLLALPNEYARFIEMRYIGYGKYDFSVKTYEGKEVAWGGYKDIDILHEDAVKGAINSIIDQINNTDSDSDSDSE